MDRTVVGRVEEFDDDNVRVKFELDGREGVVFRVNGEFYAYENYCPHMGGPVGEGVTMHRVEVLLDEKKRLICEKFSDDEIQLVCPWHGWAYNVSTGEYAGDPRVRLRAYQTIIEDGQVVVLEHIS